MSKQVQADAIIRSHVLWAMGGGLIPIPLVDFAAVTAIQLEMLQQLAQVYGVNYSRSMGKTFVSALTGTTLASLGASFLKAIPGIGSVIGGVSMSITSGASTYAVGQVAISHFSSGGSLSDFVEEQVKSVYDSAFEQGKSYVSDLEKEKGNEAGDIYQS
ncbi:MAG: YcjF family protein, partial [Microcystaceae cyanobacterium]